MVAHVVWIRNVILKTFASWMNEAVSSFHFFRPLFVASLFLLPRYFPFHAGGQYPIVIMSLLWHHQSQSTESTFSFNWPTNMSEISVSLVLDVAIIKGLKCCWWRIHSRNPPRQQRPVAMLWKTMVDHRHVGLQWGTRQNALRHNDNLGIMS